MTLYCVDLALDVGSFYIGGSCWIAAINILNCMLSP